MNVKKLLIIPLCLVALCASACNDTTNSGGTEEDRERIVYSNIPQNTFMLIDSSYKLAPVIEGYSETPSVRLPSIDVSKYSQCKATIYSMNAYAELLVQDDFNTEESQSKFDSFKLEVEGLLTTISKSLSSNIADSDIAKFNKTYAGGEVEISEITYEVLSLAQSVYEFTGGNYNPALYYNIQAYGFGDSGLVPANKEALPPDDVVAEFTSLASHFNEIELSEKDGKHYAKKPAVTAEVRGEVLTMKLDLGGIGKGYAVDKVDLLFDKYGYEFGYFNFGTSSMLVKSHALDGAYNLSFVSPRSPYRSPYMKVSVQDEKFSSSGDSEQYYIFDGVRYCHIISPKTGKPVQTGIMSATVIGGSAAEADALTTAIMAMEKDDAIKFIQEKLTDRRVAFTFE